MALTETTSITQITVLLPENTIRVTSETTIYRDGVAVAPSEVKRRTYYSHEKALFLAAVPDGQPYVDAAGWE